MRTSPPTITDCGPEATSAAPARPPIRACDEEVGRPSHQVMMFQISAPSTAARMMGGVTAAGSTTPLPMVFATCTPKTRKAAKLKNAAHITARRGESTRVHTTVAMELAASWKPLLKSKASAMTMMATTLNGTSIVSGS